MVDSPIPADSPHLARVGALLRVYVVVVVATVAALVVLSVLSPHRATSDAWVHAVIVAAIAVLLPLRWRSAARGNADALRAVGLISGALFLVNVVEAAWPGLFPAWMRVEMIGIAGLMLAVVLCVVRERR